MAISLPQLLSLIDLTSLNDTDDAATIATFMQKSDFLAGPRRRGVYLSAICETSKKRINKHAG